MRKHYNATERLPFSASRWIAINATKKVKGFDKEVLDPYDDDVHGRPDRRDYMRRLGSFAIGGMTVEALMANLSPNFAWAEQIKPEDSRVTTKKIAYQSPE